MSSSYHLVSDPDVERWDAPAPTRQTLTTRLRKKRWLWISAATAAVVLLLAISNTLFVPSTSTATAAPPESLESESEAKVTPDSTAPPPVPTEPSEQDGFLHLVIPASHPDRDLCKNLLSGTILRYPTASLMNWGLEFHDDALTEGGTHLAKISGMRRYLDSLNPNRPDDLVLMVDGYDIWFQLRPQVLLSRYFEVNAIADARIDSLYGAAAEGKGIRQKTIVSGEKRCFGFDPAEPACAAIPESPLPSDLYGNDTDTISPDHRFYKFRQRYVNSGVILGTVDSLKRIFARAETLAKLDRNYGSDQHILGVILGEQELWRQDPARTSPRRGADEGDASFLRDEYGLGVDYASKLSLPTVSTEMDIFWITHSRPWTVAAARHELGIPAANHNLDTLEADVVSSPPPFSLLVDEHAADHRWTWPDVPLLTNAWTGVAPAIIHHNGDKGMRNRDWPRVWYQTAARELFAAARTKAAFRRTELLGEAGGKRWWAGGDKANDGGVRLEQDGVVWRAAGWEEVCDKEAEKEVLRDFESGFP